jgi:hypothetical protein
MVRQFPDLPWGMEMHVPAMLWAAERGSYTTAELKDFLAAHYQLTAEQLAYIFKGNSQPAFENHVDFLTAAWSNRKRKWHRLEERKSKRYHLTEAGFAEARRLKSVAAARDKS